jgi:hypothetical protein
LNLVAGLPDVRGYDAADPARMVELMRLFQNSEAPPSFDYAPLQWWFPSVPHGLTDLFGLRYLVVAGPPSPDASLLRGGFRSTSWPPPCRAPSSRGAARS